MPTRWIHALKEIDREEGTNYERRITHCGQSIGARSRNVPSEEKFRELAKGDVRMLCPGCAVALGMIDRPEPPDPDDPNNPFNRRFGA